MSVPGVQNDWTREKRENGKGSLPVQSMASILSIKSIVRLPENRNVANEPVSGKYGKDGK